MAAGEEGEKESRKQRKSIPTCMRGRKSLTGPRAWHGLTPFLGKKRERRKEGRGGRLKSLTLTLPATLMGRLVGWRGREENMA